MAYATTEAVHEVRRRPWRGWALVGAALLGGLLLGIALTVATVIVPRRYELTHARTASGFFQRFDPWKMIQSFSPRPGTSEENIDRDPWRGNRTIAKTYVMHCQVPAAEQTQFLSQLEGQIQGRAMRGGGSRMYVYATRSDKRTGPGGSTHDWTTNYHDGIVSGVVHLWAVTHGDDVTLIVTISEF